MFVDDGLGFEIRGLGGAHLRPSEQSNSGPTMKIAVVVVGLIGLLASGCEQDPSQALVEDYCTALEEARTSEEKVEQVSAVKVFEVSERAAELGMSEEEFWRAVRERCAEALEEASDAARADEQAREAEQRALLEQQRIRVEECTDERAAGTITNTSDQTVPNVAITVLLFSDDGIQLTSSHVSVGDLEPGETRRWVAPRAPESVPEDFDYAVARCRPLAGGGFS
jgi:hypothetical protein